MKHTITTMAAHHSDIKAQGNIYYMDDHTWNGGTIGSKLAC